MKQYIDFYNSEKESIARNSADVLNGMRGVAYDVVSSKSMPALGDENHKVFDMASLFAPDYGINTNRLDVPVDYSEAFRCDVPNMSTWLYFQVNDTFRVGHHSGVTFPEGVIVGSLCEEAKRNPELVAAYYGKIAPIDNPQVALNTLLAQDGLFVYVPDGVVLEKPIQVVNITNGGVPMMVNRRVLIVVGENAQAKFLFCDHTQNREKEFLNNQVIEVVSGKNSVVDIYDMEESTGLTRRVSSLYARQDEGSNLLINNISLISGITRNNTVVEVNGENAETQICGMAICRDRQVVDNYTYVAHNTSRCKSRELFKYLLDDDARGAFGGKIYVAQGTEKVEAYQSNNNIVASATAKMYTKPQLEIYADDVKCSHGATVGQLDRDAMFYMQTRGISASEAKMLLMQAFMADVIENVRLDALRDRLKVLVEKRLTGGMALCNDCGLKCHDKN